MFNNFGLSKKEMETIIDNEIESNADIVIGIDDPEMIEMIDILKKAFSKALEANNEALESSVEQLIEDDKNNRLSFPRI